jgi:hypothetical protein
LHSGTAAQLLARLPPGWGPHWTTCHLPRGSSALTLYRTFHQRMHGRLPLDEVHT